MSLCRSHARSFLFALIGLGMSVSACGAPIDSMKALTVRTSCRRAATGEEHGAGSGLLVGTGAYVATNFHVVSCADRDLEIVVGLGTDEVRASVVVRKPEQDLAVLRLERSLPSSGATLSTVRENAAGQTVYAVGFPAAAEEFVSGITVTRGIISDIGVTREGRRLYQVDAAINPGSSGGPLFNEHGEVIGINTMKALRQVPVLVEKADGSSEMQIERVSIGEGIGFAIPVDELVPELERLGVRTDGRGAQLGFPAWLEPALVRAAVLAVVAILLVVAVVVGRRLLPCAPLFRSRSRTTPVRPKAGCRLVGRKGPFAGRVFELDRGPVVLGRDPVVCQIVFPSSAKSVSRRHCRVRWDEGASVVHLTDEGSTNGTFTAAGDRIEVGMTCELRDGEQFHIGDGTAVFRVQLTDD